MIEFTWKIESLERKIAYFCEHFLSLANIYLTIYFTPRGGWGVQNIYFSNFLSIRFLMNNISHASKRKKAET